MIFTTRNSHAAWLIPAAVAAFAAAYGNSLFTAFQFDDFNVIVFNPAVQSWAALSARFAHGIRPLLKLADWLGWRLGNGQPWAFHVMNLAVHAINTILVFRLGQRVFLYSGDPARAMRAAGLAALVFALHPVNTEAVTYIAGSSVSLAAMFMLGSLAAYDRALASSVFDRRASGWWLLSFTLFLATLAVRETGVTLPLLLLLWDSLARVPSGVGQLARHAPFWALLAAAALWIVPSGGYADFFATSLNARMPWDNALTQINALCYLLGQFMLLHPLNIDPDLPVLNRVDGSLVADAVLLLALLAIGIMLSRRQRWAGFCAAWGVLHFLPTNSLLPRLDVANDRQWYLPGIALCWTLGYVLAGACGRWPLQMCAATLALLVTLACATHARNADYATELTLWQQTFAQSPAKPRVLNNYGVALRLARQDAKARTLFLRALALDPGFRPAQQNLDAGP